MFREKKIQLQDRRDSEIVAQLERKKFLKFGDSYSYLLSISLNQLSVTQMEKLQKLLADQTAVLTAIEKVSIEKMWEKELTELLGEIDKLYEENRKLLYDNAESVEGAKGAKKGKKRKQTKRKKNANSKKTRVV